MSADVDDPKVFLDGELWPEGVCWYKPAEKMKQQESKNTVRGTSTHAVRSTPMDNDAAMNNDSPEGI